MQGSGTFESHQKAGLKGATLSKSLQKIGASRTYLFQSTQKVGVAHKAVEPVSIGMGMRTESSLLLDISLGVYKQFTYKLKNDAGIRRSSVEVLLLKNALFRTLDFKVSPAVGVTKSTFETVKIQFGKWNNYHPLAEQIVAIATEVDVKSSQQIGTREPWLFFSRECLGLERRTEPNAIAQFGRYKEDKVPCGFKTGVHSDSRTISHQSMGIGGYLFSKAYINLGLRRSLSNYNIWIRATPLDLIDLQRKLIVRSSSKEVSAARTKELSPNIRQ